MATANCCGSWLAYSPRKRGLLDNIRAAIAAGDAVKLRQAAHTLKGALGTVGAEAEAELARQLESLGKDDNLAVAAPLLAKLEPLVARLIDTLRSAIDNAHVV